MDLELQENRQSSEAIAEAADLVNSLRSEMEEYRATAHRDCLDHELELRNAQEQAARHQAVLSQCLDVLKSFARR